MHRPPFSSFHLFLAGVTKRLSRSSTPSQKEEERDRRTKQPMRIPTISTVWGGIEGPRRRRPSFIQLSPSSSVGGDKGKKRLASFGPRYIVPREIQPRGIAVSPCQKMREKRWGGHVSRFPDFLASLNNPETRGGVFLCAADSLRRKRNRLLWVMGRKF